MTRVSGLMAGTAALFVLLGGKTLASESDSIRAAAIRDMRTELPFVKLHHDNGRLTRVFGQHLAYGESPEDAATQFLAAHSPIFGVAWSELRPHSLLEDRRATQPVKLNRETGEFEFTIAYFTQYFSGVEVFRADVRVLVRNDIGFPVVLVASALRDLGDFAPPAESLRQANTDAFIASSFASAQDEVRAASPGLKNFTAPKAVVWAGVDDMDVQPQLALTFTADDAVTAGGVPSEKWLFITDIQTGEIIYQENQILDVDVSGTVRGLATQGFASEQCAEELPEPMPYARVAIGGTAVFADVNGNFTIPNPGSASVNVASGVRGQYFRVSVQGGAETSITQSTTPPGPVELLHNATNVEARRSEVNTYIHANRIRDYVLSINPAYPVIGGQTEFSVIVNEVGGICPGNAQYTGNAMRFCASGPSNPNTGWSSVLYHEYGHHLVQVGGSGQGAYGEGMGDVCSILMTDQSGLGFGFSNNCAAPLRNASNSCNYSPTNCSTCGSAAHTCGNLISGCVWEVRNELVITNPGTYRLILADLALNSILLHSGSAITPAIAVDFLTLDDTDGDISNGTPHFQEICTGFGEHNMPCPALDPVGFAYPAGRPETVTPNQSATFGVNATAITTTPIPGTGTLSYRIGSSGSFTTVPMNETSPNSYLATLPPAGCPQTIEYYVSVQANGVGVVTDPDNAPASVHRTVAAFGTVSAVSYNFQTNPGWTVTSTATDGAWDANPGVPVANCNRGNPQSDFDGSGQCWMTDNSAASSCNSDVDSGTTTLTSQVFDLSGLAAPQVSYARWFSNNTGDGPETDTLRVEISTNGGATWSTLEVVGPTSTSPNPQVSGGWFRRTYPLPNSSQFRIRFVAEDVGAQSVVEAAIDAFEIFDFDCTPNVLLGDMNCDGVITVADIAGFVLALTDAAGYAAQFPACNINNADLNQDAQITVGDIGAFVQLLTGG